MPPPKIVTKPELSVVGFEASFIHVLSPDANTMEVIPPLWERILHERAPITHRLGNDMYGIIYARPEEERSHPDELQYIAGVSVSALADAPEGMIVHTVPAHLYAVVTHRGPIQNIGETCHAIYRQWLPQSEYEHAGIADVEMYDDRFEGHSDHSEMEYWITVRAKDTDS